MRSPKAAADPVCVCAPFADGFGSFKSVEMGVVGGGAESNPPKSPKSSSSSSSIPKKRAILFDSSYSSPAPALLSKILVYYHRALILPFKHLPTNLRAGKIKFAC